MTTILILPAALLAVSTYSSAQDTSQLRRIPYKLTIAVNKNSGYEEDIPATPYVLPDNTVQMYPGETVNLEIEQDSGVIKSVKAVKDIADPSKTVIITFTQDTKKKVHELMMLKITNPFPRKLVYDATIFRLLQQQWLSTDVYPVEAGLIAYETWPEIIISIGLGGWRFQ